MNKKSTKQLKTLNTSNFKEIYNLFKSGTLLFYSEDGKKWSAILLEIPQNHNLFDVFELLCRSQKSNRFCKWSIRENNFKNFYYYE